MGGGTSRQALLERYGELLSRKEREALNRCFTAIAKSQEIDHFTLKQLQDYVKSSRGGGEGGGISLPDNTVKQLYSCLCVLQESGKPPIAQQNATFSSFVQQVAWALKGTNEQKASIILTLTNSSVQKLEETLLTFLTALLDSKTLQEALPSLKKWPSNIDALSRLVSTRLVQSLKRDGESDSLALTLLKSWLSSTPLAVRIFDLTLVLFFLFPFVSLSDLQIYTGSADTSPEQLLIPLKIQHPKLSEKFSSELLDHAALMMLNGALPYEHRGFLYPLFSSRHHGESFSTLCRQILDRGPTLLILCDKGGNIFGGFASESWKFNPQFTGTNSCFLFSLCPAMDVYSASGYNDNYMYIQQSAQTMPNGIGMGGQMEYFGLWLSADYGHGHSKARPKCSTYGSPMLSASEEFDIDLLEAWGVGQPVLDGEEEESGQAKSILDKDKSAQAILDMAGKTRHSEGLREPEDD